MRDYERAETLAERVRGKVSHAEATPAWIGGSDRFWYESDLGNGRHEFLLVDAAKATRAPAFDHARAADALTRVLGHAVTADRLPIDRVAFTDDSKNLRIQIRDKTFVLDLASYELRPDDTPLGQARALPPQAAAMPSRVSEADTALTFVNHTGAEVLLFWVDTEGRRRPYGPIRNGASQTQHTFVGHRFLVTRADGTPLAVYVGARTPAVAVIDNTPPAPLPQREARPSGLSPDGHWRAVIRDFNVVLRDEQKGGEMPVTADGSAGDSYEGDAVWSPDSSHVVVMKTIPAQSHMVYEVESSPADQEQPKLRSFDYLKPGDRIAHPRPHLFDVASRRDIPIRDDLFPNPWEITELHWDPDSRRFTFLYNQRGHQVMRLVAVDAATGAAVTVIDEMARTFIDWTNKVYLHRIEPTHEAIWMSERDGWCHLYMYDTAAGRVERQITKGPWVVRGVDRVDDAKRQIWFRAGGIRPEQDPYYVHYCRVNFDGTGLVDLTPGDGTHRVDFSPDRAYYVDSYSRVDMPPVAELRRSQDGAKVMDLERGDASALLAAGWRFPERFVAKGRDDKTDIYGVVFRPSTFDPSRKYPVIENIYAGPQGAFVPKAFSAAGPSQAVAELGFIVVQIDGMGTNWRSRAFHDVCWKNLADAGLPDRILWIRAAAEKYPYMDLSRVGIYGTSAGGQSALAALLTHGDFYRAGVADCGCHDNRMDKVWWNEQWMGWPVDASYAANSNVTKAPRLTGKLLLMVGELDSNVDPASTMQVVNALIKAGKYFDLLVVPGADHGVAGSPYGRRKLRDFFVRNLLGVTPPDWNASSSGTTVSRK